MWFIDMIKNVKLGIYFAAHSSRWFTRFLFWLVVIVSLNVVVFKIIFDSSSSKSYSIKSGKYETLETKRQSLLQHYNLMDDQSLLFDNECSAGNNVQLN